VHRNPLGFGSRPAGNTLQLHITLYKVVYNNFCDGQLHNFTGENYAQLALKKSNVEKIERVDVSVLQIYGSKFTLFDMYVFQGL
jgi:hypothetical protein